MMSIQACSNDIPIGSSSRLRACSYLGKERMYVCVRERERERYREPEREREIQRKRYIDIYRERVR